MAELDLSDRVVHQDVYGTVVTVQDKVVRVRFDNLLFEWFGRYDDPRLHLA